MGSLILGPLGTSGPVLPSSLDYIRIPTNTQTNLNNGPTVDVPVQLIAGSLTTSIGGVTASATLLQNIPVGWYFVYGSIYLVSGVQRANIISSLIINGVVQTLYRGASGYIRNLSGHNTSSIHLGGAIQLTTVSTIGMTGRREGQAGTVFSLGNQGNLSLLKFA